jgi:hypothetical protein
VPSSEGARGREGGSTVDDENAVAELEGSQPQNLRNESCAQNESVRQRLEGALVKFDRQQRRGTRVQRGR